MYVSFIKGAHTCTLYINQPSMFVSFCNYLELQHLVQLNLNNPVNHGPSMLGCNKEVAVLKMTSIKRSLPFFSLNDHINEYVVICTGSIYKPERQDLCKEL